MTDPSGVIIDGALPRSDFERCGVLYGYLICMDGVVMTDALEELDPENVAVELSPEARAEVLSDLETDIISEITKRLPEGYVCVEGEHCPGDVVVVTVETDEVGEINDPHFRGGIGGIGYAAEEG